MKKVSSILLCMLLALTCCLSAFAAGSTDVKVDTARAEDGTLTVTLSVPAGSDLSTFETTLNYDAGKLEFVSVTYGAGTITTQNADTVGKVGLYMVWQESQTEAATLATVTFKIKDGAQGSTDITFTNTNATDPRDVAVDIVFSANPTVIKLTDTPNVNENIPATAGAYVAIGATCAVAVAAAVTAGALIKRKRDAQ